MFIKASESDLEELRRIAFESEAHWGYSASFMERFDSKFNITAEFLLDNPVFICRSENETRGFWGIQPDGDGGVCLEFFYIDPRFLRSGYGAVMWAHLTGWCHEHGISQFHLVTSPQAVGFYEKMGAGRTGTEKSVIDGRPIPSLCFPIPPAPHDTLPRGR